ncbi:MAG TPA: hypothetical protein VGL72_10110 [Bryobacteraceae bacterium]
MANVTSTHAAVKTKQMRTLLRKFQLYDVGFNIERGRLILDCADDIFLQPRALKRRELPHRDDYPDDESWDQATFKAFYEDGTQGFLDLLSDLSAVLETPILIVALAITTRGGAAEAWRVEPGCTEVEGTSTESAVGYSGQPSMEECWANWKEAKNRSHAKGTGDEHRPSGKEAE